MGGRSPATIPHHLGGVDFPARKRDLVDHARRKDADEAVIEVPGRLPDREYRSMADVQKGVGEVE
ncbi:MAG TPA: DUF2795 domain-containing protein [Geminicoccaceae bacterium]|nr:DUF2795 domain-containing protein [Geminicoccaceae bacterium]